MSTRTLLLLAHVLTAVLFLGPFTVAASMFPGQAERAAADPSAVGTACAFHRISRAYGTSSLAVPALGLALAGTGSWWSERWLHAALATTALGFGLLFAAILPLQGRVVGHLSSKEAVTPDLIRRLHGITGLHALLWVATLWLMVAKPW